MASFGASTTGAQVVAALSERVSGKIFAITGASPGGLGAETALALAAGRPAEIVLLGRSEQKVAPVIQDIKNISPSTVVRFIKIDLASCASVRAAAAELNAAVSHLDVLINNAGIAAVPFALTPENVESHIGANHIGHFLLTNLVVGKIPPGGRVVTVASVTYQFSPFRFSDYNFSGGKTYNHWEAYGQSKTANILFAVALAKRLEKKGIKCYSLHPGNIPGSNLAHGADPAAFATLEEVYVRTKFENPKEKSVAEGAGTILAAALDPALEDDSGAFLDDCKPSEVRAYASDPENAEKLWALSEEIVGEKFVY